MPQSCAVNFLFVFEGISSLDFVSETASLRPAWVNPNEIGRPVLALMSVAIGLFTTNSASRRDAMLRKMLYVSEATIYAKCVIDRLSFKITPVLFLSILSQLFPRDNPLPRPTGN